MSIALKSGVAFAAFAIVAVRASPAAQAVPTRPNALHCRSAVATVLHRSLPAFATSGAKASWAVVHVSIERNGLPGAVARVLWRSGSSDDRALRAVSATAFTPASHSCSAIASSFDYALIATPHGIVTKILPVVAPTLARAGGSAPAKQLSQLR
ncbi:MAG: hypothetical protein IAI50_10870 [Candidatus Eremiobacteraeota bacterium]|nr:hypothetical protein [Candidatus Eremiobacteraeota bacterium]